jgi:hypothetical protein
MFDSIVHNLALLLLYGLTLMIGWAIGYKEGKEDYKEIVVRLRKSIENASRKG